MRHADLVKSSGVRTAVLFLSLFLMAAGLAGTTAFLVIREELVGRHQRAVTDEFGFFANLYQANGRDDLVETMNAHARAVRNMDSVYLLRAANGERIAGNLAVSGRLPPNGEVSAEMLGLPGDYDYFLRLGQVGDMTMLVGASGEDLSEVEEVFFEGAFWAALLLTVISLAGGVALSMRMNRRIAMIEGALEDVADGRFDARIPQSGSGDDLDRLGILINGAVARLGAAVETNRQISSDIAHDLKTPINRLRISVETALEKLEAGEPVARDLEDIDAESSTILSTFDALLRIAQIEGGARRAHFKQVDLASILSSVIEFYAAHAEECGGVIRADVADDLPLIAGDRDLLTQMFANLIENALKHAGAAPRIDCSVFTAENQLVARVSDNGPGIPEAERDMVLRRLYRLEKSRSTPGSGLGLTMVKAIAELHGASLDLSDNKPGVAVSLRFPVSGKTPC